MLIFLLSLFVPECDGSIEKRLHSGKILRSNEGVYQEESSEVKRSWEMSFDYVVEGSLDKALNEAKKSNYELCVNKKNKTLETLNNDLDVRNWWLGIKQLKLFYQHLKREKSVNKQTGTYLDFRFKGAVYLMERKQDGN